VGWANTKLAAAELREGSYGICLLSLVTYCIAWWTDTVPPAAAVKSAVRKEEISWRSFCCPSYLLALSAAKTAVTAFTLLHSEEEFPFLAVRRECLTCRKTCPFSCTDAGRTKSLFRKRQTSVC